MPEKPSRHPNLWLAVRLVAGVGFGVFIWISLLPLLRGIHNIGVYAPAAAGTLGLLVCLFWNPLRRALSYLWIRLWGKALILGAALLSTAVAVMFVIASALMIQAATAPAPPQATVIVLGAQIRGNQPSSMLRDRLNAAIRYLAQHPEAVAIVCGGQGPDEQYTEASVMRQYMVDMGVDPARIYVEDRSANTRENIQNAAAIIRQHQLTQQVVIATQEFHQYRAQLLAREMGFTQVGPLTCSTPSDLLLCYWVREFAAISRYWLLKQ